MSTVNPDDIPVSVTKLIYTYRPDGHREDRFLPDLSQNQTAELLAHFWPAIREHFAQQIEAVDPADWALAGQHAGKDAAAIIRNS